MGAKHTEKVTEKNEYNSKVIIIAIAVITLVMLYLFLPVDFSHEARLMTAIVSFGVLLWAFEPIPLGLTSLVILVLMLIFSPTEMDVVFSGFASPATHLVVGGMLIAGAVNDTNIVKRITYIIFKKWGGTIQGLLAGVILIQQFQALFIPSTAVRTTLMLPISYEIIEILKAKRDSNLRKLIMLAIAFGGNISGTAILTAAVGNILTVELLNRYGIINITYFQWFLYTFPLWLLLIPSIWFLLLKMFPLQADEGDFSRVKTKMESKLATLGKVTFKEKKCIIYLIIIVVLWVTESVHGLHPSIPALLGAVLMTLPGVGIAKWEKVIKINFDTILLLSVTLSIGYGLIDTGAVEIIGDYLSFSWVLKIMQHPILSITLIIILTQLLHKLVSNVSAAVVTIVPMTISVAISADIDPVVVAFTAGLTSLYGFLMAVETMPNLLVHASGLIKQKDFLLPGIYATIISIVLTILVATTWWRFLGFL